MTRPQMNTHFPSQKLPILLFVRVCSGELEKKSSAELVSLSGESLRRAAKLMSAVRRFETQRAKHI